MNYFDRIHVQGFRRLVNLDLELRPLNVLIGANGSGKTSFLDVFSLLAASASGDLSRRLFELGGMTSLLSLGQSSADVIRSLDDYSGEESARVSPDDGAHGGGL